MQTTFQRPIAWPDIPNIKYRVREIRRTCLANGLDQGKYSANGSPVKSFILASLFAVKCPAIIQNIQRRSRDSPDKMSSKAKMNFMYSVK